jgi:hypothetical protein
VACAVEYWTADYDHQQTAMRGDMYRCDITFGVVLAMVHNTLNYWGSGFCPSAGILNTRRLDVSEAGSLPVLR